MSTIIIIGSVFIFILLCSLVITVVGEISTTRRYRKKLAEFDLRSKIQTSHRDKEVDAQEESNENISEERKSIFSSQQHTPVI